MENYSTLIAGATLLGLFIYDLVKRYKKQKGSISKENAQELRNKLKKSADAMSTTALLKLPLKEIQEIKDGIRKSYLGIIEIKDYYNRLDEAKMLITYQMGLISYIECLVEAKERYNVETILEIPEGGTLRMSMNLPVPEVTFRNK